MALIPPFFLDAVVAVGFEGDDGKPAYRATGFIYGHLVKQVTQDIKRYQLFLATNRHVFQEKRNGFLRFNPKSGETAREYEMPLVDASGKPL